MCTVGIINVSGELDESYIGALAEAQHEIVFMDSEDLLFTAKETDAVVIYAEEEQFVGMVCNLILQIKDKKHSFIWVVSKKISDVNRLVYLQLGANGTIQKPCTPTEFQLVLANTVNHCKVKSEDEKSLKNAKQIVELRNHSQSMMIDDRIEIGLTRLEYRLVDALHSEHGKVFGYEELNKILWKENGVEDYKMRIANLIFYLRKKVEDHTGCSEFIRTIRLKGYMLNPEFSI
ncbi:response regulator transcription factor [Enterococcus sp. BWB1-3]|uniref:winged helix-turn-helix domain-containing protein n=1 Tax=unclassified Enterococcus TaxID=2608891 RepID=UPI001923DED6|nr:MULTISPECIES: winged helix-turn-helix domain-containing protein [unclassified Enterococcus]MBL1229160.1 response regulator transcription factor [Enterococcus sp. BWB1-3]MCB5952540.1 winged helix-turn-helix domain-containing protein [Enterococcus sp. BWT-B8]MCB5953418.1 winged helix-turn-helix domain-containing protein [Enterococcus sp. CWB-B31]